MFNFNDKNILFSLLIIMLQISIIFSSEEKCYSIENCKSCPDLDFCEECQSGFKINKAKTKCGSESSKKTKHKQVSSPVKTPPPPPPPVINKPAISANKPPSNPFQNVPVSSLQRFKDRDSSNEIINKILIFILIILVLSIVASVIYNFVKKKFGKGYTEEDGQEDTAKVVYIR